MNIGLATICSPEVEAIGAVTNPNKVQYCKRHGYEFIVKTDGFVLNNPECGFHHLIFERWRWFAEILPKVDWLLCCGADVLITNMGIRIEDLVEGRNPFLICKDANGFNSDVVLVRNCWPCLDLLKDLAESRKEFSRTPELDQSAMRKILPRYANSVEVLPQRVMNAYDYTTLHEWYQRTCNVNYAKGLDADGNDGKWQPGDFIFHCPGISQSDKVRVLREKLKYVAFPKEAPK